jgi:hypothetical protein
LTDHLLRCHDHRLDAKLAPAHVEQIFETWPEQVNDEDVVETLLAEIVDLGHAR